MLIMATQHKLYLKWTFYSHRDKQTTALSLFMLLYPRNILTHMELCSSCFLVVLVLVSSPPSMQIMRITNKLEYAE